MRNVILPHDIIRKDSHTNLLKKTVVFPVFRAENISREPCWNAVSLLDMNPRDNKKIFSKKTGRKDYSRSSSAVAR